MILKNKTYIANLVSVMALVIHYKCIMFIKNNLLQYIITIYLLDTNLYRLFIK